MEDVKLTQRIQELELELNTKNEELEAERALHAKMKEDNDSLRLWNQKLYAQIPVSRAEAKPEPEKEKIKPEDIQKIWAR